MHIVAGVASLNTCNGKIKQIGVISDVIDVVDAWTDAETAGDYAKAGLKTAWVIGKNFVKSTPVGLAAVAAIDIAMGIADLFKLW